MKQKHCDIFNACFPQFAMSYERFLSLINSDNCHFFEHKEKDEIVAFGVAEEFAVRILCVEPAYQR